MEDDEMDGDISKLKNEIESLLDGKSTTTGILTLVCCLSEVISQTAPSRDSAMEGIASVTGALIASIAEFDAMGLCRWNEPIQ